jgi:hypothetical protein
MSKYIVEKKAFKGVKMTTAKLKSIPERRRSYAILLQDLMKRGVRRSRVAGSPNAQLIMHCLQHELWQNASKNALGEISQQQETYGAISFG